MKARLPLHVLCSNLCIEIFKWYVLYYGDIQANGQHFPKLTLVYGQILLGFSLSAHIFSAFPLTFEFESGNNNLEPISMVSDHVITMKTKHIPQK